MSLVAGARLGPYEVVGTLGAGGMGEVYRARDTRLSRHVAVKVLPPEVATDPSRLHRFEREAQAASSLNHPNIITVYDVGSAGSIAYIAMELVEGETLRSRLLAGPLAIKRVLEFGTQIAAALASAHDAGIAHRDLKPANVMVSREGYIKVLDFGLAKLAAAGVPGAESSESTQSGTLIGTVEYMSPEQAGGQAVDFRADQFALGVLLHEMATGVNPFRRRTQPETLAAILRDEPPRLTAARPESPAPLQWIVERCLEKEPAARFASTRDLARDLASVRDHLPELTSMSPRPFRPWVLLAAVGVLAVGAALSTLMWPGRTRPAQLLRFGVYPPVGSPFNFETSAPAPAALSPDGRELVFGARDPSGRSVLWLRRLESVEERALPGTDDATYPFWSPDNRFIGFFADGKLKKIETAGGVAQFIADAPEGRGGAWNQAGIILFTPGSNGAVYAIRADGGRSWPVTTAGPNVSHRWPGFLPDGRHFLYTVRIAEAPTPSYEIRLASVDSNVTSPLLAESSNAAYASPGFVLFARDGTLMAAPFDTGRMRITGAPVPVVDKVQYHRYRMNAHFTVSQNGVLAYQAGLTPDPSQVAWLARDGRLISSLLEPGDYGGLRLSPDGRRAAVELRDSRTGKIDVWVVDLPRRVRTRFTFGAAGSDSPAWSPDGSRIAYASNRRGHWDLYQRDSSGSGHEAVMLESDRDKLPTDWSPDGRFVVFNQGSVQPRGNSDIFLLAVDGATATPLLETPFNELDGRVSPDGRWIAYASDESGSLEVYVSPFPHPTAKWQVSARGGHQPVWSRNGKELFYLAPNDALMAAALKSIASGLESAPPTTLFDGRLATSSSDLPLFDVSADGRTFLVTAPAGGQLATPLTVVVNWTAGLRR